MKIEIDLYRPTLLIPIKLWVNSENKHKTAWAIFDTGASNTCISYETAEIAGYKIDKKYQTKVTTGGGLINAYHTVIPDLKLADISIGPVYANVIDFPDELSASIILGLNVIKEFSVNIDFDKNKETGKTKVYINMNPKFDITKLCTVDEFNVKDSEQRFGDVYMLEKNNNRLER